MLTRTVKARLSDDVQLWLADGVVSAATATTLRERYEASRFGLAKVVQYLGVCGAVLCAFGILGAISLAMGSAGFAGGVTIAVGLGLTAVGIAMSRDLRDRYALSSRAVIALGAMAFAGGVVVLCQAVAASDAATVAITGVVVVPVFGLLAYRGRDGFLLVLAVLAFFHWVGSWTAMWGRSTYALDVEQPKAMCLVALAVFAVGVWHERHQARFLRFFVVYEALALAYLNLSLLILSIWSDDASTLPWILALSGAALAQIVVGARLQNAMVLGFGVTTAVVDLFTRYYERFWDRMSLGAFLAVGGGALFAVGAAFERAQRPRVEGAST